MRKGLHKLRSYGSWTRVLPHHPPPLRSVHYCKISIRPPQSDQLFDLCGPELCGKPGRLLLCILQFPSVILPRNNHRPTVTGNGRNGSAHNHKRCRANWRNLQTGSEGVMGSERGRGGREGGMDEENEGRDESADKRLQSRLTNCRQS